MSKRKPQSGIRLASVKKSTVLLVSVVLMITLAVGGTVAFLVAQSISYKNTFVPGDITTEVVETLEGNVKSNVMIKNTGTADAYIRAFVSVTWQDESGNVYGKAPVIGTDYNISYDLANGWQLGSDGFYYWTKAVSTQASTGVLIKTCSPVEGKAPDGYELTVEILGSGIQTLPTHVVTTEWSSGVSAADGKTLTVK